MLRIAAYADALPEPLKSLLGAIRRSPFYVGLRERFLIACMRAKHRRLVEEISRKTRIRVVFLVIRRGIWKADGVFRLMMADPLFDPVVLVCPQSKLGETLMHAQLRELTRDFEEMGYPVLCSYNHDTDTWLRLEELGPDLLFLPDPFRSTREEYHQHAFENYLSCYVPYHHEVGEYSGNQDQYNQWFHNAMWRIFSAHECSRRTFQQYSVNRGRNVVVTGYPSCENLFLENAPDKDVWKPQDHRKKRVIWAPHHTIDSAEIPMATFLRYADFFRALAVEFDERIQWAFKPHPNLKFKLYAHADWGKEKADAFYAFWENTDNTQLELCEYQELFKKSDAMIHDCGSFLAEYLYTRKPVLFLYKVDNITDYFNDFGAAAFRACRHARNEDQIRAFISDLVSDALVDNSPQAAFCDAQLRPYFSPGDSPSMRIVRDIRSALGRAPEPTISP